MLSQADKADYPLDTGNAAKKRQKASGVSERTPLEIWRPLNSATKPGMGADKGK